MVDSEPIDAAWRELKSSRAYWTGYPGMLIGSAVYCSLYSLYISVITVWQVGPVCVVIALGFSVVFMGLAGVVGGLTFALVRGVNTSLNGALSSRFAAISAACLTGLLIFLLMAAMALQSETSLSGWRANQVVLAITSLLTCLQCGAWLSTDRAIRKFEQRIAFEESDKVAARGPSRLGIKDILIVTFWVAGTMAILTGAAREKLFGDDGVFIAVLFLISLFVSVGLTVILVVSLKRLRWLQKKIFSRSKPKLMAG